MSALDVGDIRILPVSDGIGRVTPGQLFSPERVGAGGRGHDAKDWLDHAQFLDADGRLEMPVGGLLVLSGPRVVLVDVGFGPTFPATVENGAALLDSLAAHGLAPRDVTDVVLTHLHPDHIGWASVDGVPTFPRATYRCDARDWAYFVDGAAAADAAGAPDGAYRRIAHDKLAALADRVEPWSRDGTICPGVDHRHAPGHTPGNTVVVVSSGTERAVFLGDVVHCPVQLLEDDWARIADVDEAMARRTQIHLAQELEGSGAALVGAHFPGLRFGRVLPGAGRRQWVMA
jgi:glyoxylase-like metal-dependent hydrolase (beta-lactamase superfamily II)